MGSTFHPGQGPGGMGPPLRVQGCSSSPTKKPPRWSLHSEPRAAQGVCVEPGRRPQAPRGADVGPRPGPQPTGEDRGAAPGLRGLLPHVRRAGERLLGYPAAVLPPPSQLALHCAASARSEDLSATLGGALDFRQSSGWVSLGVVPFSSPTPTPRGGDVIVKDNNKRRDVTAGHPLWALDPCLLLTILPRGGGCFHSTDENTELQGGSDRFP